MIRGIRIQEKEGKEGKEERRRYRPRREIKKKLTFLFISTMKNRDIKSIERRLV